jgi:Ca2+-binding EF-hand superfamily protein
MAAAAVLLGSAAIADNMGPMPAHGMAMMGGFDFAAADTNKDGKISLEEFNAYRAANVAAIDTDKDGKISVEELANMRLKQMQDAANAMATRMVKNLDTDGDGKLSAAELVAAPMGANLFEMADTNHDGVVDQAEADAAAKMMRHGPHKGGHHKPPMENGAQPDAEQDGNGGN